MYENDCTNVMRIIGTIILFYIFNAAHWWGNFELGTTKTRASTYYCIVNFGCAVLVLKGMLLSGGKTNRLKLHHEFYKEKLHEL